MRIDAFENLDGSIRGCLGDMRQATRQPSGKATFIFPVSEKLLRCGQFAPDLKNGTDLPSSRSPASDSGGIKWNPFTYW
ncbi:hypothetical protein [Sinorhizobium sp. M4_45]|uniref:hypothetical protein n=1 Tax=Sinorhizobium sp. M4_45 TaxID=2037901 RepID=UPI0015E13C3A|nr:hypothetical protein [Sinorhizobium sp. M4_45]